MDEQKPATTPMPIRTRKSMAGPALLSNYTSPDNIKDSMMPKMNFDENKVSKTRLHKEEKDETRTEGPINIIAKIDIGNDALCCQYNEDFKYIAIGRCDGYVNLYNTQTNQKFTSLFDKDVESAGLKNPVTAIKHRPVTKNYPVNNCFTCTYSTGYVKCWNYNFSQCVYTIKEPRQTFGLTYHPRLPKFVTYGDDMKIYFYDEESKVQERVLCGSSNPKVHDGPRSRVFAAVFNPRSNHELITGGWDNMVHYWDLRQPHAFRSISGVHICGEGLDINNKGTEVLTCAYQDETQFQIWDYATAKLIKTFITDQYPSQLYAGKFIHKYEHVVNGGCRPNLIRIVDLRKHTDLALAVELPAGVYSIDIGPEKADKHLPNVAFVAGKKLYQIEFY